MQDRVAYFSHFSMSHYTPSVIVDPYRAQSMGPQPTVQSVVNPRHVAHAQIPRRRLLTVDDSQPFVPSPMFTQQQVPQYMPPTMTPSMPIPITARTPGPYLQQPFPGAQSLPMYTPQSQYSTSGYASSYMYGTPATTQFVFVQDRSRSPSRHHRHSSGHRHRCGHRHRHRCFHHRHRTYSDPEYDYRFRRY